MDLLEKISYLKWNFSKEEFINFFSHKTWYPPHPTQNAIGFSDIINNKNVSIVAYFTVETEYDKLSNIVIIFTDEMSDVQLNYFFEYYVKYFDDKYKKRINTRTIPNRSSNSDLIKYMTSKSVMWVNDGTVVSVDVALADDGSPNPSLSIRLSDRYNDPITKIAKDHIDSQFK